jgi:hypothetical protein
MISEISNHLGRCSDLQMSLTEATRTSRDSLCSMI